MTYIPNVLRDRVPEITITVKQPCDVCNRKSFAEFTAREIRQTIVGPCVLCGNMIRFVCPEIASDEATESKGGE
jgi:hypothetical protein